MWISLVSRLDITQLAFGSPSGHPVASARRRRNCGAVDGPSERSCLNLRAANYSTSSSARSRCSLAQCLLQRTLRERDEFSSLGQLPYCSQRHFTLAAANAAMLPTKAACPSSNVIRSPRGQWVVRPCRMRTQALIRKAIRSDARRRSLQRRIRVAIGPIPAERSLSPTAARSSWSMCGNIRSS